MRVFYYKNNDNNNANNNENDNDKEGDNRCLGNIFVELFVLVTNDGVWSCSLPIPPVGTGYWSRLLVQAIGQAIGPGYWLAIGYWIAIG